jgi:HlyD family secretion protein
VVGFRFSCLHLNLHFRGFAHAGKSSPGVGPYLTLYFALIMKKLALFACLAAVACSKSNVQQPQVKPLVEAVYASGFVVASNEYDVISQAEGYFAGALVEVGGKVKKGEPILTIEGRQESARLEMATAALAMARRNAGPNSPVIAELSAARATAASKKSFDSLTYERYKNLSLHNSTTRNDLDRARLASEASANDFKAVSSRLEKAREQVDLDLQQALRQYEIASAETGRFIVRAESDGNLLSLMKEKGELVRRGEQIAVVGDNSRFELRFSVDEMDVRRVKPGQDVVVKIDAFGAKVFNAKVIKVHPYINTREQSMRVDAAFTESDTTFYSGLGAEGNIIIQRKERTLVIPKGLLLEGDSVLVSVDGEERKLKVTSGIATLDEVEIVSGLEPSAQLVITTKK